MPIKCGGRLGTVRPCRAHFERDPGDLRPGCFEAAFPGGDYCRPHQRERALARLTEGKALNRRRGLCRCGAVPMPGLTQFGKPWRTCARCWCADRLPRAKRRAEIRAMPKELRRYVARGRRGHLQAVQMHRWEIKRGQQWREAERPPMLRLANDKQRAFVRYFVEQGERNAERAAIRAGYCAGSTARGGRAAAVYASTLRKRPDIQAAIRQCRGELKAARKAELHEQESRKVRATIAEFLPALEAQAMAAGPQSNIAREIRRARGQAMLRLPGHCRCGAVADPGLKSCAPCRRERRHYRRRQRARRRLLRIA